MTEEFLCYLWRFQLLKLPLITIEGEEVIVKRIGRRNHDAGPDFLEAILQIGTSLWAGNVEIHIKTCDWIKHGHLNDKKYRNVILHLVYENDYCDQLNELLPMPTLELKDKIEEDRFVNYQNFILRPSWIACENQISLIDPINYFSFFNRLAIDRLERKTKNLKERLQIHNNDYEQCFFELLAINFGFNKNAYAFELLAKNTAFNLITKIQNNSLYVEALLFGQAGFLDQDFIDDYPKLLKKEYSFLKKKYSLIPIEVTYWNFLRLRPSNFPSLRIAQFSALLYQSKSLLSSILESNTIAEIFKLFKNSINPYWKTHYIFDRTTKFNSRELGEEAVKLIIINTIIPFLFIYGKNCGQQIYSERAIFFLENLKPENNSIIRKWTEIGIKADSALISQALIELKNTYCNKKRCLECQIGILLLKEVCS